MSRRVVIFGTSDFGIPAFENVSKDLRFKVVGVVTQPAKPTGRHQVLTPTPVEVWAKKNNLKTFTPSSLKTSKPLNELSRLSPDLFLVASYGLILPQGALDIPAFGCLNIHASRLPKYRGASPISAAILQGDEETGITFMSMDAGCDTGPMLKQLTAAITTDDTRLTLEKKLSDLAATEIVSVMHDWQTGKIVPQPQPKTGATLAPRLKREDGRAVWHDAAKLARQIHAYQPWPGLWTTWQETEFKILVATVSEKQPAESPGTIVATDRGWGIACEIGLLIPTTVQFAGKKPQPASTIPGGYPNFIGSRLD